MSKSVIQLLDELFKRVAALEDEVRKQRFVTHTPGPAVLAVPMVQSLPLPQQPTTTTTVSGRAMCPKCGVKPAYFFHVRTCPGQKEEQNDADQNTVRRRDQGTP